MAANSSPPEDSITYNDVMEFIRGREWPVTSPEVAEEFGISQQAAYYRLRKLYEKGELERKKIGQTVLWRAA